MDPRLYLDHQKEVDEYLEQAERDFAAHSVPLSQVNPELWERLERARARLSEPRA